MDIDNNVQNELFADVEGRYEHIFQDDVEDDIDDNEEIEENLEDPEFVILNEHGPDVVNNLEENQVRIMLLANNLLHYKADYIFIYNMFHFYILQ